MFSLNVSIKNHTTNLFEFQTYLHLFRKFEEFNQLKSTFQMFIIENIRYKLSKIILTVTIFPKFS